jgi:ribosomal protein S18 acetylase RimI-like enzyme
MTQVLKRVDAEHVPAYLESSNPRNISLYRRHGFEVVTTIQLGSSPTVVPMVRPAR